MQAIKRKVVQPERKDSELVEAAQKKSATQWLFCPFTRCDTSNWSAPTGAGLIPVGELYPISNVDDKAEEKGFRYAETVAVEIENAFPKRVKRITSLAGVTDSDYVSTIQEVLLGETMEASEIAEDDQPVPNGVKMRQILRSRMQQLQIRVTDGGESNLEPIINIGSEIDQALGAGIEYANRVIESKQREIEAGVKSSFDNAAQRAYLFLGQKAPTTLKLVPGDSGVSEDKLKELSDKTKKLEKKAEKAETKIEKLKEELKGNAGKSDAKKADEEVAEEIETESNTPVRCIAKTASGSQCKNDALEGSKFCQVPSHSK